jgi:hypothetical protein
VAQLASGTPVNIKQTGVPMRRFRSTPVRPCRQKSWAIIRYAANSGDFPDEDAAAFDGWYADREDALAVAQDWSVRYPQWIVGLVHSDTVWFGQGDYGQCKDRALTAREREFMKLVIIAVRGPDGAGRGRHE